MLNEFHVWIILMLNGIRGMLIAISALSGICGFLSLIMKYTMGGSSGVKAGVFAKKSIILFIIFTPLAVLVPNTTQATLALVIPKLVNNEKLNSIPDKILDLANYKLDEMIKETHDSVSNRINN